MTNDFSQFNILFGAVRTTIITRVAFFLNEDVLIAVKFVVKFIEKNKLYVASRRVAWLVLDRVMRNA